MGNDTLSANKVLNITRVFDASKNDVFNAFSDAEALSAWWGPAECATSVISLDFKQGGMFHYKMDFNGHLSFGRIIYNTIQPTDLLEMTVAFADEHANAVPAPIPGKFPLEVKYRMELSESNGKTTLKMVGTPVTSDQEELNGYAALNDGMNEGFRKTFDALDVYITTQKKMHKWYKTSNKARVTTYLNFPGNTEEAFNFYREVFNGEFTGKGLQHFADVVSLEGAPPMDDAFKKLIIHAELTILGGHVLMATDAPESMGFKMVTGTNMHINVEPTTKEETKRLFTALAEGGTVTMELTDMFFGAYYGSCTDKYGINWMFTCLG